MDMAQKPEKKPLDLQSDRDRLIKMAEVWAADEHMRTTRHNALFHLQTTIHRMDSILAEFTGFDPVPRLSKDDLAHLPEDKPE